MERRLIARGVAAGGFAGLVCALFTRVFVEPWIQRSVDYQSGYDATEAALRKAAHRAALAPGPDIFSRGTQRNVGAPVGLVVFTIAMGALFAVVFVLVHRRYGDKLAPRLTAVIIAAGAFLGVYLIPFLKYPANPPAIGHADTIHARGDLYLGMLGASIASVIGAFCLARWLAARWGGWNASIATAIVFVAWMAIIMAIFPSLGSLHANVMQYGKQVTETPRPIYDAAGRLVYPGFPADVLFKFRLYSVLNEILLWSTIGLTFGLLTERALAPANRREDVPLPASVPTSS